jgi:hypothetical protein
MAQEQDGSFCGYYLIRKVGLREEAIGVLVRVVVDVIIIVIVITAVDGNTHLLHLIG